MEHLVQTLIDGCAHNWTVGGEFSWGEGGPLCPQEDYPLEVALGCGGYRILDLPTQLGGKVRQCVADFLGLDPDRLESYHREVDEDRHFETIDRSRELRFASLDLQADEFVEIFERALGVKLSPVVGALGRDHVQLRINRPGSTDYNPPHRDGSLPVWQKTLNVWLPIAGVNALTSLSIVPKSHRLAESECWQTKVGGATIAGKPYRVPAISKTRAGPLQMIRAPVSLDQVLVFTPFLIHGLALNFSQVTRMALEFRFEVI